MPGAAAPGKFLFRAVSSTEISKSSICRGYVPWLLTRTETNIKCILAGLD